MKHGFTKWALAGVAASLALGSALPIHASSSASPAATMQGAAKVDRKAALAEADALLARSARDYGRPSYAESRAVRFNPDDNKQEKSAGNRPGTGRKR